MDQSMYYEVEPEDGVMVAKSRRWRWLDHILKMEPTNLVLISYPGKLLCITPIFQARIIMLLRIKL